MKLSYELIEDGRKFEPYPKVTQPTLIFHGKNDTAVPPGYSITFAEQHPHVKLHLMNSDHELLNVLDDMWMETEKFLFGPNSVWGSPSGPQPPF